MGKVKKIKYKPKPRPKPVVNYPPVPTKKWVPPDQRKKPPKPGPKYVKPEGISQKLKISTLKKVWNKFDVYGDAALLTGHFSQYNKRFTFKTNGYQGSCNSAIACIYSKLYKMAHWNNYLLDEILMRGDELYHKSTLQGDKCLIEIPPEKIFTSFFFGSQKITLFVTSTAKITRELISASEEKAKQIIVDAIQNFLNANESGIFYIKEQYVALWISEGFYYYFDPGDHDEFGNPWTGVPGLGVSFLGRFKTLPALVEYLFNNFPSAKEASAKCHLIPCGIARIVNINIKPPETFEDLAPQDVTITEMIEEPPPPPNVRMDMLEKYIEEDSTPPDPQSTKLQETSPYLAAGGKLDEDVQPSFMGGSAMKLDSCRYAIPKPTYLKGENARLTYYTELVPDEKGILRASTCQTNPNFSKYLGRQSMGNALSALIMLRICRAKHWVPKIVDNILKNGEYLYRDAMENIPRTQSLKLSNFPKKIEYEGKKFTPEVDEYAVIGQMQSHGDILDLGPALDDFLTDNDCCIILGPQILAVWIEDGEFYMFDPNERDGEGKALVKEAIFGSTEVNLEPPTGVACVVWCKNLKDIVDLYVNNTAKEMRRQRFSLSKVTIKDFVEVSEDWNDFKGIDIGKWILRGTFNQGSFRFTPESRNFQGGANALISLAMTVLFDEREWSSDTIDEILMNGDLFYTDSVAHLQEKGLFSDPHLKPSELNKSHFLRNKKADFVLEDFIVNGLAVDKNQKDVSGLRKGLESFFKDNDYGVLTTNQISLPIWKKKEAYYYMDPYSRDENGVSTGYGTSCSLRILHLEDLVSAIEANLASSTENQFSLTKVIVTLYEAGAYGIVIPPLNHYTQVDFGCAILRSNLSDESEKYEVRKGKQTVPMCITALGFNKLKPASEWTRNDLDSILDRGDALYIDSMAAIHEQADDEVEAQLKGADQAQADDPGESGGGEPAPPPPATAKPPEPVAEAGDDAEVRNNQIEGEDEDYEIPNLEVKITTDNVKREVNVGPNTLTMVFSNEAEGNIKESLHEALHAYFTQEQTEDDFNKEAILETKHYTVALWRDDNVFYVFDPRPRSKSGEVFGKDDWDPEPPEPEPEPEEEAYSGEEEEEHEDEDEGSDTGVVMTPGTGGAEQVKQVFDLDNNKDEEDDRHESGEEEEESNIESGEEDVEEEEEFIFPEEVESIKPATKPKKSPSYWLDQENKNGRACTVWFANLSGLLSFLYENIPTKDRLRSDFVLKRIKVENNLQLKSKFKPEQEPVDAYIGDWYDFKELDHGKWILRGSFDLTYELFPASNRGKQGLMSSVIALGLVHIHGIICFSKYVPDSIMVYGDKLLTFMKRLRKKQLLQDSGNNLKADEIDWLIEHEEFTINDIPRKICISEFMSELTVEPNVIVGDIKAQNFEDVMDVQRGLAKFFEDSTYGVMYAKGLYVAVWRGEKMYYMFDGMKRGPNGIQAALGTGCITRYLELEKLVEIFLKNLPTLGKSEFCIHKLTYKRQLCPRERAPVEKMAPPKSVSPTAGLKNIVPGKSIICGTINQEDPRFGKGPNVMSAPIAIVALTMSLIHKPEMWSRPIVDEILILGSELYEDSVNDLGFDFNPWEDKLDIYRVRNDYNIGVIKANCELRTTDQRGVIDGKGPNIQNLRQGMERFFEENTHGILITEPLTLAIFEYEPDEGDPVIFVFDPNPRSTTGMPLFTGTACVLSFVNAKMASDHIIGCILDPELKGGEFLIVPVEIVVGSARTNKKPPEKSPTRSSVNVLPRCSKLVASENKRKLRKLAEEDFKRKEAKRQQMIGRNGYHLKGGEALLRGYKSQNSECYMPESRNNQDIPNCIAAVVMHSILSIDDWNYRHIDMILDTGDQLYIDSYIAYGPIDNKLGMENVLRKFFMSDLEVHVTIYKPIISEVFTPSKLNTVLEAFFQQENVCILNYNTQWISVFFKAGFYFMFDPHERDIEGNLIKNNKPGAAVVVRFDNLNAMALKIVNNLGGNTEEVDTFSLWIISVESK